MVKRRAKALREESQDNTLDTENRISQKPPLWALEAETPVRAINQSIVNMPQVRLLVYDARRALMGRAYPHENPEGRFEVVPAPYKSLTEAWSWIRAEQNSLEAQAYAKEIRSLEAHDGHAIWTGHNEMLSRASAKMPPYFPEIATAALGFFLRSDSPEVKETAGPPLEQVTHTFNVEGYAPLQSGEEYVFADKENLAILAVWAAWLRLQTASCWHTSQCVEYVLTGNEPELPLWRIQTDTVPGGWTRSTIVIYGSYNDVSLRDIHRIVRQELGTYRKKALTPLDEELILFVEGTPDLTWSARTTQWNNSHPDGYSYHYQTPQGLIKAYQRALERREQP